MYRVVMVVERQGKKENVKLFDASEFGEAMIKAVRLVHQTGIPASQIDVLQRNSAGLWESIWAQQNEQLTN